MPIYEYYCPDNHTIYQFFAKTLAQGKTIPRCPENPKFRMKKVVSAFAITSGGTKDEAAEVKPGGADAAMGVGGAGGPEPDPKERRHRFKGRGTAPRRDPNLYDY